MKTILITGATRGLGLATAHALAGRAHVLVAGPDAARTASAAAAVGGEPVVIDLSSLDAVREVAATLPALDAIACNAGIQIPGAVQRTEDGFERTFQVNHLGHLVLLDALPRLPERVVFVGSGTHDPAQRTGMPAPSEAPIEALARGEDNETSGRGRYSTSKLLATAITPALARAHPDRYVACFDPGLMTATGLARGYAGPARRAYALLAPLLSRLPFASTPERSAAVFASLLLDDPPPTPSGTVLDHRGRPARRSGARYFVAASICSCAALSWASTSAWTSAPESAAALVASSMEAPASSVAFSTPSWIALLWASASFMASFWYSSD
jgi:protochlorophyllide reductase